MLSILVQPREHEHVAARQREGIDFLAVQHMKPEVPGLAVRSRQGMDQPLADLLK